MFPNFKYKAGIIGAGRIASGFDTPKTQAILTHAHAYAVHPRTDLVGFFDVNKEAAKLASKKWGGQAFPNLKSFFGEGKPDIVSICTPDENHFSVLIEVAEYKPKLVICEKPLGSSLSKIKKVLKSYHKKEIPILVNYSRRFDKTVQKLRKNIQSGRYGKILCASGIYTKGILHNGSHLIDLCRYLFGEVKNYQTFYNISDYKESDKSIAGFLEFERCRQFHLMVGDERRYSVFELDIFAEKKRLKLIDSGFNIALQKIEKDPRYKGFYTLGKPRTAKTSLSGALFVLIDNAIKHLEKKEPLICDIKEALKTEKICHQLLRCLN